MPVDDLISVAEVAERLRCHVRSVHRWIRQGQLEATKLNSGATSPWLVTRESLAAFENRRNAA